MMKQVLVALGASALAATVMTAQGTAPQPPAGQGRGAAPGGGRGGGANLPTEEQWTAMSPKAREYVDKAKTIAGDDPDLQFDFGIFCKASGGSTNPDRAAIGVPNSEPKLEPYGAPSPAQVIGAQRLFDNFYWIGNTGIGAWLITSDEGYILFDTMNSEDDAKNIIIPAIEKLKLDPKKIKYMVFGHNHFDHTGGGEYIQRMYHPKVLMGREDWKQYFKMAQGGGRGRAAAAGDAGGAAGAGAAAAGQGAGRVAGAAPAAPAAPPAKMTHDVDALDGQVIQLGDLKLTIYQMTGHTPGSIGGVVNVKWQGRDHPLLIVTAGSDIPNINALVGGYEHIWDAGLAAKAESVMQVHPNTNMNILARMKYVDENYKTLKTNPLLYGPDRTARYLNIVRNCTLARMEILGW